MRKEFFVVALILSCIALVFFYKFFLGYIPFPGDLLIAEYNPWKTYSFLGYNPGSYPHKAQYFDVLRQLYPWKTFVIEQLKNFQLPLWNPYNFSGAPLLANFQSAVLYPLGVFYFILSLPQAWSLLVFLQPFLASLFIYFYARKIEISKEGSLLSSVSYGFSYFMIVWLQYNTIGQVILWLPLLLLAGENLIEKKNSRWIFIFIWAAVCSLLGGHIQVAGYSLVFALIYLLFRNKNDILFFSLLFGLSIGISGVQLLPGLELIKESARIQHDFTFLTQKILVQPHQLIMLLIPDFFGNPATRNYFLQDTYVGKVMSVGLVALLFAAISFMGKKNIFKTFYMYTVGIILLLTTINPVTYFLYQFNIPFFSSSSPTLMGFLLAFSLSILAGLGVGQLQNNNLSRKKLFTIISGFTIIFVVIGGLLLVAPQLLGVMDALHSAVAKKAFLYNGIFFGGASVLLVLCTYNKKRVFILISLLILIQLFELFRAFHKFNPFVPVDLAFPSTSVVNFLQKENTLSRFWGYRAGSIESNYATQLFLFSPEGYDPLYPKRYGEFIYLSDNGKFINTFTARTRSDAVISQAGSLMENPYRLKILEQLGVEFVLDRIESASTEKDFSPQKFEKVFADNNWRVYKNRNMLPRVFLTSHYKVFSDKKDFENNFFRKDIAAKTVFLESALSSPLTEDKEGKIDVTYYSPNRININTSSVSQQLLFLSDTYFPGWEARIDGRKTDILRANYTFRAIVVPNGNHTVVMEYMPSSFKIGSMISLASVLSLGILLIYFRKAEV